MKIITVVGARPQFIKAAVVSRKISETNISEVIVHTGQHYDCNMSDVFFDQMSIPDPDYRFDISGLSHGAMTGRMLEAIESVILKESPDCVMVYGDTNSTLAGALAAVKLHVPIAHVEAGLRSFNMRMPEEVNRILTDRVSTLLLCPTQTAMNNLKAEGYDALGSIIKNVGDVMQDAAMYYSEISRRPEPLPDNIVDDFILCTIHRAENTASPERLRAIVEAINEINATTPVVLPLHPRTQKILASQSIALDATVIGPVGYLEMVYLIKNCTAVMTDSGGLQKEAFFFSKACVTLRDETEWVELIEGGYNCLVGADKNKILDAVATMKSKVIRQDSNLYGGGTAASAIVKELQSIF
jgi:UDP-GlcNAc3NAcA epimerase